MAMRRAVLIFIAWIAFCGLMGVFTSHISAGLFYAWLFVDFVASFALGCYLASTLEV